MDELRAFFNPGPSGNKVQKLRGPLTNGFRYSKEDTSHVFNRKEEHRHSAVQGGTDYAQRLKDKEAEMFIQSEQTRDMKDSLSIGLESMEKLSTMDLTTVNIDSTQKAFKKYSYRIQEDNNKFSINGYKQKILEAINDYSVVIVEGPTGCGKTTQVPQWILDDASKNKKHCRIIITQPRRIAAISIARRVASERGWTLGQLVGFQVALENQTCADTLIRYVTTGVLLQKLVSAKNMNEYTHIILDEVHERGQEMDFLLIVVKRLLYTVSPNVKVVLMSATFNTKVFLDYFNIFPHKKTATCVEVAKKEKSFNLKTFYLNQLNKLSVSFQLYKEEPTIEPEKYHLVVKLVHAFENIDKQEEVLTNGTDYPSVLIFLPGINEIEQMFLCLTDEKLRRELDCLSSTHKWWVLPLHSTITADEQVRVFQKAPPLHRKIILATNIAESSITVPDIKYVVDFCLMKQLVADKNTNFTSLEMTWASKANCEQRSGRAGRVRDGRVYRIISDKIYDNLPAECKPEILRCPLERLVLLAKTVDMGPPSDILALALDPPDLQNIQRTVLVLKEMGALTKLMNDQWVPDDGELTFMGRIMTKLPIDVRLSKLIALGNIFGCLEECIIMAAAMSVKNLFSNPFRERLNAYNSKLTWADGCTSDCITFLNVYKVWNLLHKQKEFKKDNTEGQWARRFFIQARALRELNDMVKELTLRLSREGIEITRSASPWNKEQMQLALKVLLAGAFYPQYFVQVSRDEDRERDAIRTLGGLDPRNTVYLKNFPDGQPGKIYARALKNIIKQKIGDEPRVTFDKNSRKVYLTFEDKSFNSNREPDSGQTEVARGTQNFDPTIPGQVVLPVYKSVKARQLKMDIRIPLLPPDKAQEMAAAVEADATFEEMQRMVPRLPPIEDTYFEIFITNRQSIFKFWARDKVYDSELNEIQTALNSGGLLAVSRSLCPGMVAAAPCSQLQGAFCRARILRLLPNETVEVMYIDWGFTSRVKTCNVRMLGGGCVRAPPLCAPCVLARIRPASTAPAHTQHYPALLHRADNAKVYSVVHGVVNVELLIDNGRINVNDELVKKGYAVYCEESYDSKLNHDLREKSCELTLAQQRAYNREQIEQAYHQFRDIESPNLKDCVSDACLNGPFSPLETVVHNLMYSSREKQVTIEWNSVNSVLLDTAPQEVYERLLVAGEIGQNELNSKLSLRHTTLMPNIPGLPAILGLMFSPNAELRRSACGNRYASVLCGVGSNARGVPYFPEHDILLKIDAELSVDDVALINHIRYLMDYMMSNNQSEEEAKKISKRIRDNLLALLTARRKHYEPESIPREWEWKSVPEHELLEMSVPDMDNIAGIYPMHVPQELLAVSQEQLLAMKRDNDHLKMMVNRNYSSADLVCKLCNTVPMNLQAMRLHLYSNVHQEKEEDFNIFSS